MMMQVIKSINEENLSKFCNTKKKIKIEQHRFRHSRDFRQQIATGRNGPQ